MNNEALDHAYNLFVNDGYNGNVEDFNNLMSTNDEAVNHAYSLFKSDGYTNSSTDFKKLIEPEPSDGSEVLINRIAEAESSESEPDSEEVDKKE